MKFYRIKALILHNSLHQNIKLQSPLASHSQSLCPSLISSPSFGEILNEIFKSFFNGLGVLILKKNKNFKKYRFDIFSIEKHSLKTP